MGLMDMKNLIDTLRNMYDVTKILFADWSMKLFIIMHGMDHKTLSILNTVIRVHGQVFTFYKFIWCHQNTVFWVAMLIYTVKCLGTLTFF